MSPSSSAHSDEALPLTNNSHSHQSQKPSQEHLWGFILFQLCKACPDFMCLKVFPSFQTPLFPDSPSVILDHLFTGPFAVPVRVRCPHGCLQPLPLLICYLSQPPHSFLLCQLSPLYCWLSGLPAHRPLLYYLSRNALYNSYHTCRYHGKPSFPTKSNRQQTRTVLFIAYSPVPVHGGHLKGIQWNALCPRDTSNSICLTSII